MGRLILFDNGTSRGGEEMKVGIFPMVADLLHPGHISALHEAKKYCDYLIVALNANPTVDNKDKNKPVQTVFERYYQLMACKYVDKVIPYEGEEDLLNLLCVTDYDIRFIGSDHSDYWTGKEYEEEKKIPCKIVTRAAFQRSTSLRKRILKASR